MAQPIAIRFGKRVRQLRKKRDWDQVDLAAEAEISRQHVSAIERAQRDVCLSVIGRIAKAFGVEPSELFR